MSPGQPARMMANRRIKQSRPWIVIPANREPYGKLAATSAIVKRLSDGVAPSPSREREFGAIHHFTLFSFPVTNLWSVLEMRVW